MIIFQNDYLRISLLTSRLIRTEIAAHLDVPGGGTFTDLPTQTVQNRDFGEVKYSLSETEKYIEITTEKAKFLVSKKSGKVLSVTLEDGSVVKNFKSGRLPGTARTLDTANGAVKLECGITSGSGASLMDDSKSLLIKPDGSIAPRPKCSDRYWFAYGTDFLGQMRDFFRLTGEVPLIPKYALGNWWSRYKAYTQEEYRTLMQTFIDKKLPITVATIDMDWHWTDVVSRFGEEAKAEKPSCAEEILYNMVLPGWTGYTWNTELFPDHKELLSWLHEQGFKVTLNVHPSQGIRFFEDAYEPMCRRLGLDPSTKAPIKFDPADPEFMKAYFEVLHRPLEDEGVDFWWIDWQQGKKTKIPGLDPLWALNHYHTLDSGREDRRPLILSRYSGLGSHRYPLGFSGDTQVTWKSLDFQPYFTNSAANSGYTWWSHDIGGHMRGIQDDELYLRWLQYGVFSPINRLHSSNSDFMGKEPWKRSFAVNQISEKFLRLRHKLIPYLYTANYRTHKYGEPICMPMYYRYDCHDAYEFPNQYIFGGKLIVAPITTKMDKRLNLSSAWAWLPEEGVRYTDIFNGRIYKGRWGIPMYRDLDSIPVLAREGTIVPMYRNADTNDLSLDQPLEIHIWRGNGEYELYEDDGETNAYKNGIFALTKFEVSEEGNSLTLTITPPADSKGLLPEERKMHLCFRDVKSADAPAEYNLKKAADGLGIELEVSVGYEPVTVKISGVVPTENENFEDFKNSILTRVQCSNFKKSRTFGKKLPRYVEWAISELDPGEYEDDCEVDEDLPPVKIKQ